ncbi:MAG: cell division protein FtsA [Candidatus Levybacteria bacterium RIFCSPHIGHO2_02_FULL_42_12]|nr:MAG: cell division protein FtsA [Candidatus Levybacteria bacterium RIFCSPHIGHO2_01_FULL_42_15]OGH33969.1 MAG: cell division protein FtsA [Candidatus Levybacteria bacterium RIFCSPHIGHO2_02_FULL_42_12]OGH42904.1 MAG: cell division protein FtsA [Candidatus Levybacteria bacterium RIFCSPLOWO2_01_FULL_42_15]
MSEGKIVVGVDVGTSKITAIIAKVDEAVNVLGVSEVKSAGIRKGQIVDIEEAVSVINTALEAAERMAGYSVSHVVASIGGAHIESQNSRGIVAISNPHGEIRQDDIERVIEAARAVSLPSTKEVIHVIPKNYSVDGQEGIKDPVGMTGVRLEVDTHIITAGATSLRNLEKALSEVGVDVNGIVFNGYASALSVLSETEKELGVVLVDIGAGTTDIAIYVDGSIAYSSVLPFGARHITNDLAIGLRISIDSAEKIKLFFSQPQEERRIMILSEEREKQADSKSTDEVDLGQLGIQEDLRKVSRKTLIDGIIRPRLNEIFTMVGLEIKKSGYGGQTPSGIVITGGGANTVSATDAAKRMLAMPVRLGVPTGMKGIIDEIQNSAYATVLGLIMYGYREIPEKQLPFGFSLPSFSKITSNKIFKKVVDLIKSFIP